MKKRVAMILLVLVGSISSVACQPYVGQSKETFNSPEQAIERVFKGINDKDLKELLSATAYREKAENYDSKLLTERLHSYQPLLVQLHPSTDKFSVQFNEEQLKQESLHSVRIILSSFLLGEESEKYISSPTLLEKAEYSPEEFSEKLRLDQVKKIEVKQIAVVNEEIQLSEKGKETAQKRAKVYGADDTKQYALLLKYDGDYYILGITAIEYGGTWKVDSFESSYLSTSTGLPEKLENEKEFEKMIKE